MTGLVKGLFGGESNAEEILQRFQPAGFSAPGLRGRFENNRFTLQRTPATAQALRSMRRGFRGKGRALRAAGQAILADRQRVGDIRGRLAGVQPELSRLRGDIRGLRDELRPGFGRITHARVAALEANREAEIGNVREELQRRRIAGSSFARQEIGSVEARFAMEEDRIRAEAFMQELAATNELIMQELGVVGEEADLIGDTFAMAMSEAGLTGAAHQAFVESFDAAIGSATATLDQLNLETGLAAGLSQMASQLMNSNLTAQAEARAAQELGAMNFLADVIGAAIAGGGKKKPQTTGGN